MPHDLFGDVLVRPSEVRTRRSSPLVVSVAAHAGLLTGLLVTSVLAPGVLPAAPAMLSFFDAHAVMPAMPVAPRAPAGDRVLPSSQARAADAAPVEEPHGIAPESQAPAGSVATGLRAGPGLVEGLPAAPFQATSVAPPPPAAPIRIHEGIQAPRKLVDVAPAYPALARAAHVKGTVILEATIDVAGNVEAVRTLRSIPLLDAAALDAVRRWKFSPTRLNGIAVPVIMTVTVNFTLR